jgi:hypothetical protein
MKPIHVSDANVAPLINRAYRESATDQYIRELLQNAFEANATTVEIGPEWQAVERLNAWRFMIADNGCGMIPEHLLSYLGQFGQGGKAIGGVHENFGIGSKSSTLPWNPDGVVILSYTEEYPFGCMLWLRYDSEMGLYGMRELSEDGESVVEPYDDTDGDSGIDWTVVAPEWVREKSGTVVVLLGGNETKNTFWGKRGSDAKRNIRQYINTRYWQIPEGVSVFVSEINRREDLPKNRTEAFARPTSGWKAFDRIRAYGAAEFSTEDKLASGSVELKDGTSVQWYLRKSPPGSDGGYKPKQGFVAAMYRNELYSMSYQPQTFRAWGVASAAVAKRLTLVIEPMLASGSDGVFPSQARATLLMLKKGQMTELPWDHWREEFRDNLPIEIIEAMNQDAGDGSESDERLLELERLLNERYEGETLAMLKFMAPGDKSVDTLPQPRGERREPSAPEPSPKPRPIRVRPRRVDVGTEPGNIPVPSLEKSTTSLPKFDWVKAEDLGAGCEHFGAVWTEPNNAHKSGSIQANEEFPPVQALVLQMQKLWPDSFSERIEKAVKDEIRTSLIVKVAEFRGRLVDFHWKAPAIRETLENPATLTFAMVGFASEQEVIKRQLTDLLGKPRKLKIA